MAKIQTLHHRMFDALQALSDSNQSVELPMVDGKAPGMWNLLQAFQPPKDIHRNSVPAQFTVTLAPTLDCVFSIMVNLISDDVRGNIFVLGYMTHDQSAHWKLTPEMGLFVGARYSLSQRIGTVIISNAVWKVIKEGTGNHGDWLPVPEIKY